MDNGRILLVDDEKHVLFVLQAALERLGSGYEIVAVPDGEKALARLREGGIDLMITDLRMPGLGGLALTEALRESGADTAVVWLTGHDGCERRRRQAQQLGVYRCLNKPVEIVEIRRVARAALKDGMVEIR